MKNNRMKFRMSFKYMVSFAIIIVIVLACNTTDNKEEIRKKVDSIIGQLSLEEKAKIVVGIGSYFEPPDPSDTTSQRRRRGRPITDTIFEEMRIEVMRNLPGAAGFTAIFPEKGITTQVLADGPAGLRISPTRKNDTNTYYCTAFPIATLLASTWDIDLVYKVGQAMGNEVLEYNADIILGPGMNLQRDPLCGRNFEYYSEDPLITGKMASAQVRGIQSNGVGTSIKHYAANNQETNRNSVNTIVSERALREIYLKGFEIAVKEAQPWTVMSSYNRLNGEFTSESHDLLTKILRDDWGFEGYVMTDWGGGSDVVAQMKAGNDLLMPGQPRQSNNIVEAVKNGELEESVLDNNVRRILTIMMKTPKHRKVKISNKPNLQANAELTRQVACEGMVLLENRDKTLPLARDIKNVAVFGATSYEFISSGTGSGDVNEAYTVSLIEGLENGGLEVDKGLTEVYSAYIGETRSKMGKSKNWLAAMFGVQDPVEEMKVEKQLADEMAERSDVALITIGRVSGEGGDKNPVAGEFYLTDTEKEMIKNVYEAFNARNKKIVVVLNVGSPIETATWIENADAVLLAWQPGQEAGNSVVDVLKGNMNPSGKLAVTFPVKYEDSPTAKNFPGHAVQSDEVDNARDMSGFSNMRRRPWEVIYEEDIYVGYRYYNTFNVDVAYEFGYGKSYTEFAYENIQISSVAFNDKIEVSVDVSNTGDAAGKEVVQVYLSAPDNKMEKPASELVAFAKSKLLAPGEKQTLTFELSTMDLASFDEASSSWVAEAGEYTIKIGASSLSIKQTANFNVENDITVETVSKALVPEKEIKRLSRKN